MSGRATISPGATAPRWEVRVPGSKSITNRALLLAAVATGESTVHAPLLADDTHAMIGALRALGARIEQRGGEDVWSVGGLAGPPTGTAAVDCQMAGTVGRFLVPMLAAGSGSFELDAHPQLRRRPLGPVLTALRAQGAVIAGDAFPLRIDASGLRGGEVAVDGSVSSQFLSGLLMAAPFARANSALRFKTLVSRPYLRLTLDAMRAFGVEARIEGEAVSVRRGGYRATAYTVEPDASTASYFLAAAALSATTVRLPGLDRRATAQGDMQLAGFLEQMGCTVRDGNAIELTGPERLRGVEVDMGDSSDVFMTLACLAPFAQGPTTIRGIGHARVKESDRVSVCAENLRRLGIGVEEGPDYLRVHPGPVRSASLPTHDDHRVAMAFALIGLRASVTLESPGVVAKTCPEFFELWRATGARISLDPGPGAEGIAA